MCRTRAARRIALLGLLFLGWSGPASAQVAQFEFEGDLTDSIGNHDGILLYDSEPGGTPTFVEGVDGQAIVLDGHEGVEFPLDLTLETLANDVMTVSMDFMYSQPEDVDYAEKWLFTIKQSDSWGSPGFTLRAARTDENQFELRLLYTDGSGEFGGDFPALGVFDRDSWVSLSLTFDFPAGTFTALTNENFVSQPFPEQSTPQLMLDAMRQFPPFLGWVTNTPFNERNFLATIAVDNLVLRAGYPPVDLDAYRVALVELTHHIEGTATLTEDQLAVNQSIVARSVKGNYEAAQSEVDDFVEAYEAAYPPLFTDRRVRDFSTLPAVDQAMMLVQQDIFDSQFVTGKLDTVPDMKFEAADVFPGIVAEDAPRVSGAVMNFNGSYAHDPAVRILFHDRGVMRPLGYYAAPGERVTMTFDPSVVGKGYEVVVGAHQRDLSTWLSALNRFPRISNRFDIDSEDIEIANPFGGGLYIRVPDGGKAGWVDVTIDGAVKSPFYRGINFRRTNYQQWLQDRERAHVPWADLESRTFMMTVPLAQTRPLVDARSMLDTWDLMWDSFHYYAGRPLRRPRAEWYLIDSRLPGGALGAGYPMTFSREDAPYPRDDFWEGFWFRESPLNVEDPEHYKSGLMLAALHEFGHNLNLPTPNMEEETIVQMVFTSMYNLGRGLDIDLAFNYSEIPDQDRDQAAMDWMMTFNFRNNNEMGCDPQTPGDPCHELRYQHRGHAKYVDLAMLLGWDALHEINKAYYERWRDQPGGFNVPDKSYYLDRDDYIETATETLGVNILPLLHFWGYIPSDEARERYSSLPLSPEIFERLEYYRSIVPRNQEEFRYWYDRNRPTVDPVHHGRYDWTLEKFDSENLGQKMLDQIEFIQDLYFGPDYSPNATPFALNAGLNDAWYNPATSGQGVFVNVFPELGKVFIAMFTFDRDGAEDGATADIGGPGQRWLTAIGDFDGSRAELDVGYTTGGVFDSAEPAPATASGQGTLVLEFSGCGAGSLSYDLPGAGRQGTIPLERVVKDNEALCESLAGNEAAPASLLRTATQSDGFSPNPGLNDAWFNPATNGQGVLVNVFPGSNQLFMAKFTFDTERPAEDATAVIGGPGQRWFTAIGPIEGDGATMDVAFTTGGVFDGAASGQQTATGQGTATLSFESCAAATLEYDLPSAGVSGAIDLQRVVRENEALCEQLSAAQD